ncbi:hypothetical protein AB7M37_002815 [Sinorhizobium fredii]
MSGISDEKRERERERERERAAELERRDHAQATTY